MSYNSYIFLIQGFLLACISNTKAENALWISGDPIRKVNLNENVIANCQPKGEWTGSPPDVQWFDNKNEAVPTVTAPSEQEDDGLRGKEASTISPGVAVLKIFKIKERDSGTWTCRDMVSQLQAEIRIQINTRIEIKAPLKQNMTLGREGIISCKPVRIPNIENAEPVAIIVTWKKDGVIYNNLDGEFRNRSSPNENGLEIWKAKSSDAGVYTCEATADTYGARVLITLTIYVPPKIEVPPARATAKTGQSTTFNCKATGKPLPTYKWYKDNGGLPLAGERYEIKENLVEGTNVSDSTLTIKQVIEEDEGDYKCLATNDVGTEEKVATLKVYIPPEIRELNNVSEKEATTARMVCKVYGKPAPEVRWENVGKGQAYEVGSNQGPPVAEGTGEEKTSVTNEIDNDARMTTSTLTITNLQKEDAGKYMCEAKSIEAGDAVGYGYLSVQYKPTFSETQKSLVFTWNGQIGVIDCFASGVPKVEFNWFKGGSKLTSGSYSFETVKDESAGVDMYRGTLRTDQVNFGNEDTFYGTYLCEAYNDMGKTNHTVELRKADLPMVPAVSAKEVTPSTADLQIVVAKINNGPQPTKIYWEYTEPSTTKVITNYNDAVIGKNMIYIKNLTPNSVYNIEVTVESEAGTSDPFRQVVNTPAERVPYPIEILSNPTSLYSTKYNLQWKIPKNGGSPITSYTIRYREVTVKPNKTVNNEWQLDEPVLAYEPTITLDNGALTTYEVRDLGKNRFYQMEIQANNREGAGEKSSFIIKTKDSAEVETGGQSSAVPSTGYVSGGTTHTNLVAVMTTSILSAWLQVFL